MPFKFNPIYGRLDLVNSPSAATWYSQVPSGTINGSNTVFTLAHIPFANSLFLTLNGAFQQGGGGDYTLSSATITFSFPPQPGSIIIAQYQ